MIASECVDVRVELRESDFIRRGMITNTLTTHQSSTKTARGHARCYVRAHQH